MNNELESFLVTDRATRSNFELLKNLVSKIEFIPFIGAGLPTGAGCPDWDRLIDKLALDIKDKYQKPEKIIDYPREFSKLSSFFDSQQDFFKAVFKCIQPTEDEFTIVQSRIAAAFDVFITTNFDNTLEDAYKDKKGIELYKYFLWCHENGLRQHSIMYLHGHISSGFAILREEDYCYFYPTISRKPGLPMLENYLQGVFYSSPLLFFGFSFYDEYIAKIFKYFSDFAKNIQNHPFHKIEHFAFFNSKRSKYPIAPENGNIIEQEEYQNQINNFYNLFQSMNIYPIVYTENIFVSKFLAQLPIFQKVHLANIESKPFPEEIL